LDSLCWENLAAAFVELMAVTGCSADMERIY